MRTSFHPITLKFEVRSSLRLSRAMCYTLHRADDGTVEMNTLHIAYLVTGA